jgi:hypothetical protein
MKLRFSILILFILVSLPTTAFLCGKQRWFVKVCKDPHNGFLYKNGKTTGLLKAPRPSTINALVNLDNPFKGHLPADFNSVSGIETSASTLIHL